MREEGYYFPENQKTVPPGSDMKKIKRELELSQDDDDNNLYEDYKPVPKSEPEFKIGDVHEGMPSWSQMQYPNLFPSQFHPQQQY
jgi:hypothetical protein